MNRKRRAENLSMLEKGVIPPRYLRNASTISASDQLRLLNSSAVIVGAGGLGGWLAEILARTGVGTLRLIDRDRFDETNLNRQLYSDEKTIGRSKVDVAVRHLSRVNSDVVLDGRMLDFNAANGGMALKGCDIVADCLDSISTRFLLEQAAGALELPIVSSAVAGKTGRIITIGPGDPGFRSIYGTPAEGGADHGEESTEGNPPFTVALLASLQAAEIVRILLGQAGLYRGRMLFVDLEDGSFDSLAL